MVKFGAKKAVFKLPFLLKSTKKTFKILKTLKVCCCKSRLFISLLRTFGKLRPN